MNQPQEAAVDQQVPCPCELKSLIFNMDFGAGEWGVYKTRVMLEMFV